MSEQKESRIESLTTTQINWKLRVLALFLLMGIFFIAGVSGFFFFLLFGGTNPIDSYALGFIIGLFITHVESLLSKLVNKKEKIDASDKYLVLVVEKAKKQELLVRIKNELEKGDENNFLPIAYDLGDHVKWYEKQGDEPK